jgi:hypothetical protein
VIVWLLGVAHTLGAGSDASTPWLRGLMLLTGLPIVYLATLRILGAGRPRTGAKLARGRVSAEAPAASTQRLPLAGPHAAQHILSVGKSRRSLR